MSSWLTQTVRPQFPRVGVVELLDGAFKDGQQSVERCNAWVTQNATSHMILRDTLGAGSAAETLELPPHQAILTDGNLRIVWRGDFDEYATMQGELAKLK
ncbi:MAG: hypothetical protein KC503_45995 [Myxococcales bacterium]|nr:hypothetical protein [Myxococcales bacterium]